MATCNLHRAAAQLVFAASVAAALGAALPENKPIPAAFWDTTFNLSAGAGYRDNVLLAHFSPEGGSFVESAAEMTFMRLSTSDQQFFGFFSYDDLRYLGTDAVDHEQSVMGLLQFRHGLSDRWQANVNLQYLFFNQIFDASLVEGDFGVIKVKGHSISGRPGVRWKPSPVTWFDAEVLVNRQYFVEPLDDYWEGGPKFIFGLQYGHKSEFTLSYEYDYRDYDNRAKASPEGFPLDGTGLTFTQSKLGVTHRHHWDTNRHWRSTTRLGLDVNRDNGSGYYDYDRFYVSEQIRWTNPKWEIEGSVRLSRYDYALQTVDDLPNVSKKRLLLVAGGRIEHKLSRRWKLYGEFEFELSDSNNLIEEYSVNTARAGVDFEF